MWSTVLEWPAQCISGMSLEECQRTWALPAAFSSTALFKTLVAPLSKCLKLFYKILAQWHFLRIVFSSWWYFFMFWLFWVFVPVQAFPRCTVQRLAFVVVHGLLIVVVSLVEHRLLGPWASVVAALGLWSMSFGSCAWAFSCSTACGIFPDRGLKLCPLSCQVASYLLHHQGRPPFCVFSNSWMQIYRVGYCDFKYFKVLREMKFSSINIKYILY